MGGRVQAREPAALAASTLRGLQDLGPEGALLSSLPCRNATFSACPRPAWAPGPDLQCPKTVRPAAPGRAAW